MCLRCSRFTLFSTYCTLLLLLYAPPFWNASIFTKAHRSEKRGVLWLASYPVCCDWPNTSSVWWKCYALYHVVTKTIKPAINEAFVAFSEGIITDYNDSYSLFMHCAAPRKHNTMSASVIVETPNKHYSTQLKTHIWIVSSKFFKYRHILTGCESEAPDCPCDVGIASLYSVHIVGYSLPESGNSPP